MSHLAEVAIPDILPPNGAMIGITNLLTLALSLQLAQNGSSGSPLRVASPRQVPPPTDSGVVATLATTAPVIDGRDDDEVWRNAPPITAFKQWQPTEGKEPRFKTEARVAYDAANLYVFVRAFDPHPDSIIKLLERRDSWTASDMVWLFVDSYHDRRTGYEFGVNAAGVKIDQAVYNGGNEDGAWDAVWDVATRVDSLGWTAEFRIPLSQMRYSRDKSHIFGFTVDRDIYRYAERVSWPSFSQAKPDLVSQLGSLSGLDDLEAPRKLEAVPYIVSKNASTIANNRYTQRSKVTAGGDVKYRVAPNVTLDATVNPDFGQVESDPAVLNLSAYESFFDERRPFFVAGRGLFRFDVNCSNVNCNGEGLYYSRRIGHTPQLAGVYGDTVPLEPTTILGAAKLTGQIHGGLNFGFLDAVTERASGLGNKTFEPTTNYGLLRVKEDLRNGNSTLGAMITAVNRKQDQWSSPYLATGAYAGAMDFRHRFLRNNYEISGSLDKSRVNGSPSQILALQRNAVHYYQRPDGSLTVDANASSLDGDAEEFKFDKVGGQHLMFESAYQRRSPGFDVNDMGFLRRADQQSWNTWVGFFDRHQRAHYNRLQWNNNWWRYWTANGLPLEAAYNTNTHITLTNNWSVHAGGTVGQLGTTYDDRASRGGPAVRQDTYIAPWMGINGNDRRALVPYMWINYSRGDGGLNHSLNLNPELDFKMSGQFSSVFSLNWTHNINDHQWFGNFTDGTGKHYTFAHLDQNTTSANVRLNYTFSPGLSLQTYMQPFVSKGTYSNVRQLSSTPRAADYAARYAVYNNPAVTNNPGGFNFKEFQSNVVLRWEYKAGSTVYVVWNEGRQGFDQTAGNNNFQGDVRDLLRLHPANTFLVKWSYWLNR